MQDFNTLDAALRRNHRLAAAVCLALLGVTIASLGFSFAIACNARQVGLRMPVLVVPGAIGGIYSPGLTEENVRATARYLTDLATNFSGVTGFRQRFDELESFAAPQFLANLQQARALLARDVDTQNQSRIFFAAPDTEHLTQTEPGVFEYSIDGERVVYSSGLAMDHHRSQVHLHLLWGIPSERNRAGIVLTGLDVRDTAAARAGMALAQH